jgi:hypothetical protein
MDYNKDKRFKKNLNHLKGKSIMKFKESKSLIEEGIEREGTILVSLESKIYHSLKKKGEEFIMESFDVFWEESIYNKDGNYWDDYLIINDKSWNQFLSLIG